VRYPGQSMRIELADGDFYDIETVTGAKADGQVSLGAAVILDSAHGWHNTYRLIDLAASHGMTLGQDGDAAVPGTAPIAAVTTSRPSTTWRTGRRAF
jgi:hypothetical protein